MLFEQVTAGFAGVGGDFARSANLMGGWWVKSNRSRATTLSPLAAKPRTKTKHPSNKGFVFVRKRRSGTVRLTRNIILLTETVKAGNYLNNKTDLSVVASQATSFRLRLRRGYDRMGVIYFPFRSYLMKKVRTWYELLHKGLFSRAIKVL